MKKFFILLVTFFTILSITQKTFASPALEEEAAAAEGGYKFSDFDNDTKTKILAGERIDGRSPHTDGTNNYYVPGVFPIPNHEHEYIYKIDTNGYLVVKEAKNKDKFSLASKVKEKRKEMLTIISWHAFRYGDTRPRNLIERDQAFADGAQQSVIRMKESIPPSNQGSSLSWSDSFWSLFGYGKTSESGVPSTSDTKVSNKNDAKVPNVEVAKSKENLSQPSISKDSVGKEIKFKMQSDKMNKAEARAKANKKVEAAKVKSDSFFVDTANDLLNE